MPSLQAIVDERGRITRFPPRDELAERIQRAQLDRLEAVCAEATHGQHNYAPDRRNARQWACLFCGKTEAAKAA